MVVLATFCYALAGVWSRKYMTHLTGIGITCAMLICSSSQILLVGAFTNSLAIDLNIQIIGYGIGIGIICTALAYLLFLKLIAHAGMSNATLVTLLIPIVAIVFNAFMLNETLKIQEITGFIIILMGLVILNGNLFNKTNQ